jgi:hypothetical protein
MLIISKLSGGIGNQLFQYAFGRSLALRFECELKVDISSFENYSYHSDFELSRLLPDLEVAGIDLLNEKPGNYYLHEGSMSSLNDFGPAPDDCKVIVIAGYWQNETYINPSVVGEIYDALIVKCDGFPWRTDFGLDDDFELMAVHIRRRDYAHMGLCMEEYYIACIKVILNNNPNSKILLFSDEPNYSFSFLNKYFPGMIITIKTGDDFLDLYIMSKCESIIVSNSTFSWWGAYFNESNKKYIFCPEPWIIIDNKTKPCPGRWRSVQNAVREKFINSEVIDLFIKQASGA